MLDDHLCTNSQRGAHMGLQSWMIKSWPIIDWFPPPPDEGWPSFLHMGTHIYQDRCGSRPCVGSTVWVGAVGGSYAGLAWDWVELRPGVLLLADPNSIVTNLQVTDARRLLLGPLESNVSLNTVLHRLPWQEWVCSRVASAREGRRPDGLPNPGVQGNAALSGGLQAA